MITSCPECNTRFRATPEQLAIRQGLVKCGSCGQVFNGFARAQKEAEFHSKDAGVTKNFNKIDSSLSGKLEELTPSTSSEPISSNDNVIDKVINTPEVMVFERLQGHVNDFPESVSWTKKTDSDTETAATLSSEGSASIIDESSTTDQQSGLIASENLTEEKEDNAINLTEATDIRPTLDIPTNDSPLWEYQPSINLAPKKSKKALLVILFLILSLIAQAAYLWRTEITTYFPQTKPTLDLICSHLGCKLPLLRQIDSINIESSNMETDEKRINVILVNAVLRNRSDLLLAYPLIEITLTDNFDRAIARRSLDASEYAPKSAKEGFAPDSELVTHMAIETNTLKPSGYRLRLYYR